MLFVLLHITEEHTVNKLLLNCRPLVVFTPSTKEHRHAYYTFLKKSTWSHSPVQFALEPGYEDVPTMCRIRLSEYYVDREFNIPVKKRLRVKKPAKLSVVKLPQKID